MVADLHKFDTWVEEETWPAAVCPICKHESLVVHQLTAVESVASAEAHDHPDWDPDWIEGGFQGTLRCALKDCSEWVVVAGDYRVGWSEASRVSYQANQAGPAHQYRLRYTRPALILMEAPVGTPPDVVDAIASAAQVIWTDPSAAANRLRHAVELLLTAQRVSKTHPNKHGKRDRSTAHQRIETFGKKKPEAADQLMAVKWIGNEGSHTAGLSAADVISGAEHLHYALRLIYDKKDDGLKRQAAQIIKRKKISRKPARGRRP